MAHSQLEAVTPNSARGRISGEPVTLSADLATPFGLILHERTTNAAKHGALTVPSGTVSLRWAVDRAGDRRVLGITGREQGGPPVRQHATSSLGSMLIESGLPDATVRPPSPAAAASPKSGARRGNVGQDAAESVGGSPLDIRCGGLTVPPFALTGPPDRPRPDANAMKSCAEPMAPAPCAGWRISPGAGFTILSRPPIN